MRRTTDRVETAVLVQGRAVARPELAGGLDDDIRAERVPVDPRGIPPGQHRDRGAADGQRTIRVVHRVAEPAEGGVEGQQVRQRSSAMRVNARPTRPKPLIPPW